MQLFWRMKWSNRQNLINCEQPICKSQIFFLIQNLLSLLVPGRWLFVSPTSTKRQSLSGTTLTCTFFFSKNTSGLQSLTFPFGFVWNQNSLHLHNAKKFIEQNPVEKTDSNLNVFPDQWLNNDPRAAFLFAELSTEPVFSLCRVLGAFLLSLLWALQCLGMESYLSTTCPKESAGKGQFPVELDSCTDTCW